MLGALFVISAGIIILLKPIRGTHLPTRVAQHILVALLIISCVLVLSSSYSLAQKQGLPRVNQILAWGMLALSLVFVFVYPRTHGDVVEVFSLSLSYFHFSFFAFRFFSFFVFRFWFFVFRCFSFFVFNFSFVISFHFGLS
jgi:hypothetical protein